MAKQILAHKTVRNTSANTSSNKVNKKTQVQKNQTKGVQIHHLNVNKSYINASPVIMRSRKSRLADHSARKFETIIYQDSGL